MNQKELQEHYKRVFDTESGKQVLLDLERVTNTTRVTVTHKSILGDLRSCSTTITETNT